MATTNYMDLRTQGNLIVENHYGFRFVNPSQEAARLAPTATR
jgi:hypothetical protein